MASAQFDNGKHTTKQATSGHIPHDFRERENYSNPDIDKARTHLNQRFGCQTGDEARLKLRKRIAECDAAHPPKRVRDDRKTSLEIHIPAPREDLDDEKQREFFEKVYTALEDVFGKENVIYGVTHFDEVHEYYDPRDKQKHFSRAGLHAVIIPYTDDMSFVPEKYKSGLNMNNFYRKNLPTIVNKKLDEICQEVFGFDYQDGSKVKNTETIEQLKEGSARLKKQRKTWDHNHDILVKQRREIEKNKTRISKVSQREKDLQQAESSFEEGKTAWYAAQKAELEQKAAEDKELLEKQFEERTERYKGSLQRQYTAKEKKLTDEFEKLKERLEKEFKDQLMKALSAQNINVEMYKKWIQDKRIAEAESEFQFSKLEFPDFSKK